MKKKGKRIAAVLLLAAAFVYYYITLPAINIHSGGFWLFMLVLSMVFLFIYTIRVRVRSRQEFKTSRIIKAGISGILAMMVIYGAGSLLSSPVINANRYQQLIAPQEKEFTEDIEEISYEQIPLLDKESAEILAHRKMGSMADMVSQFEVGEVYSQSNYQGKPVRVIPLVYASTAKWFTNHWKGIPAYIKIDMATQDTELVQLSQPIRYSPSDYLNRNIYRHIRFRYPTYIFDELSFEIDEEGTPYWICPVKKFKVGLFGGQTIGRVVICNAVTGETKSYKTGECPSWIDQVYPADLLIELYNYHGSLINGYFNSKFGQKGCLQATDGYNYIAMEDDMWVYTGITSLSGDQSNVGFVLINQRTMETRYYDIHGAGEHSAMESAQGKVQNLGYQAVFPLLLNIANEPTYLVALKDDAGLVKKVAMVNVQQYQNVAVGDTVAECEEEYMKLYGEEERSDKELAVLKSTAGIIAKIAQSVIEGNSHFLITMEDKDEIFDVSVTEFPDIIKYNAGDFISLDYEEGSPLNKVTQITG